MLTAVETRLDNASNALAFPEEEDIGDFRNVLEEYKTAILTRIHGALFFLGYYDKYYSPDTGGPNVIGTQFNFVPCFL
jgi:hypothetical protein